MVLKKKELIKGLSNEYSYQKYSFPWSRLFAVVLLLLSSYFQYLRWGAAFRIENGEGNWIALGGPSLFYPTGLVTLLFAMPLLIYILFMVKKISVAIIDEKFIISEHRWFWFTKSIEININTIKKSKLIYGMNNMWFFWVIPLGLQSFFLFEDGFAFLLNPFKFGLGIETGIYYIIHALTLLFTLILLLSSKQYKLSIKSDINKINLIFWRGLKQKNSFGNVCETMKFIPNFEDRKVFCEFKDINFKSAIIRNQILIGTTFLIINIIFSLTRFYAGLPMRICLYFVGIIYLFKGINRSTRYDIWDILISFALFIIPIFQIIYIIKYLDLQLSTNLTILFSEIFISLVIFIIIGFITRQKLTKK